MSTADFDWNQMRAFLATVETGSLSAAARRLGLTQPTLSRQIAALERDLALVLFQRIGRSLVLTEAGADLLVHVRAMGEAANRLALAASGQTQEVAGVVRVTASDIVAAYLLPDALRGLRDAAPALKIEIVASNSINDLLRREADIAIRHVRPDQPDLIARRLPDTDARMYASSAWLAAHGRPASSADLAGATFIGLGSDEGAVAELQARGIPVTLDNVRLTANSVVVSWALAQAGLGIGVMLRDVAEASPGMEEVLPDFEPIPAPTWLVAHRELHTSPRIRLVFDMLARTLFRQSSSSRES